jgi:hypothetical protein
MAQVNDLIPGDVVTLPGADGPVSAIFVADTDHPLYRGLRLVVWRMLDDGQPASWSHDALGLAQHVGEVTPVLLPSERMQRLREALHQVGVGP